MIAKDDLARLPPILKCLDPFHTERAVEPSNVNEYLWGEVKERTSGYP